VQVETIDPSVARVVRGLPSHGLTVGQVVKNGPAARAGLEASTRQVTVDGQSALVGGDTIVAIDGEPVATTQQLAGVVAAHKPGDRLQLAVVRGGKRRMVTVTLGNAATPGS